MTPKIIPILDSPIIYSQVRSMISRLDQILMELDAISLIMPAIHISHARELLSQINEPPPTASKDPASSSRLPR